MAAPTRADVEGMIVTALAEFELRIGTHMQVMQADQVSRAGASASFALLADGTRQEFVNCQSLIEQLIIGNNATFDEHKAAMQTIADDLQQAGVDGARNAMALEGTQQLNENNLNLSKDIEKYALELKTQIEKVILDRARFRSWRSRPRRPVGPRSSRRAWSAFLRQERD